LATFEEKVEATVPALRRYARALARDPEIADELVQDTLLSAFRSEFLFNGDAVRGWLYATLIKLNRNRPRSLGRWPTVSPDAKDASEPTGVDGGSADIERALSGLVEDQRNALLLVVLEGLTYREVAEVQRVPIDTVTSRVALARREIKDVLEGRPAREKA